MPAKEDSIKDWIATEVKAAAKQFERRGILGDPTYEVTVSDVSKLESQVRVKTLTGGVRYFTIKVSEHY